MERLKPKAINSQLVQLIGDVTGKYDQHFHVEFMQNCQDWLDYSLYAYGDLYVYRCGIEALFHQYHMQIKEISDDKTVLETTKKMCCLISLHFTDKEVIQRFESEEKKSFTQSKSNNFYKKGGEIYNN